ncbi:hypothetical protein [Lysinibacillus fusiformis]|nr:hypothetical protein BB14905_18165 [Bacillus sp. B14905]
MKDSGVVGVVYTNGLKFAFLQRHFVRLFEKAYRGRLMLVGKGRIQEAYS